MLLAVAGAALTTAQSAQAAICSAAAVTVTPMHSPDGTQRPFYADFGHASTNHSGYAGYELSGASLGGDVWIKLSGFTGGQLGLAANQSASIPARATSQAGKPAGLRVPDRGAIPRRPRRPSPSRCGTGSRARPGRPRCAPRPTASAWSRTSSTRARTRSRRSRSPTRPRRSVARSTSRRPGTRSDGRRDRSRPKWRQRGVLDVARDGRRLAGRRVHAHGRAGDARRHDLSGPAAGIPQLGGRGRLQLEVRLHRPHTTTAPPRCCRCRTSRRARR